MSDPAQGWWTIEELAQRVGMSVRNIRAYQSRGLIPAPQRRGRVAYYAAAHQQALERIHMLQQKGYNLAAIEEVIHTDDDPARVLHRVLLAPLLDDEEVVLTRAELAAIFDVTPNARRLGLGLETGLLRELGDGRYTFPSKRLLDAVRGLVDQGLSLDDIHGMQTDVARHTYDIARHFVLLAIRSASAGDPTQTKERFDELCRQFIVVLGATFAVNVRRAIEEMRSIRPA
jgi:DNA-binding transcriptional MerR regulator